MRVMNVMDLFFKYGYMEVLVGMYTVILQYTCVLSKENNATRLVCTNNCN